MSEKDWNWLLINGRVCPQPTEWNRLWELLSKKSKEPIMRPMILAAWWHTSDTEKHQRFMHHLTIASELSMDEQIDELLGQLPEQAWHHRDE